MTLQELKDKWKKITSDMNQRGVPMPTIRDPKTGFGSVSLTLVFISSVIVVAGIIGKSAGVLGGLDMNSAMEFFWTAVSLYFGRQFQTKSGAVFGTSISQDKKEDSSQTPAKQSDPSQDQEAQRSQVDDPDGR